MAKRRTPPVRIVVDVHEEVSGIATVLAAELGAEVDVASLPTGDYAGGREEWLRVPGIGPERARALEETVARRWNGS